MGGIGLTLGIIGTILSLILVGLPYGLALGLIAIVFSVIGKKIASLSNQTSGVATAGLVLGIIAASLGALSCISCAMIMGEESYLEMVDSSFIKARSAFSNILNHYGL